MASRLEISPPSAEQLAELRARRDKSSGGHLFYLDFTEVMGQDYPIAKATARKLFPIDLQRELDGWIMNSNEVFLAKIEDMIQDFLAGLKEVLAPPKV